MGALAPYSYYHALPSLLPVDVLNCHKYDEDMLYSTIFDEAK